MSKIVLFEGLDNCFKTTNVKALFNFWNKQNKTAHILHYSGVKTLSSQEALNLSRKLYSEMFETFEYFHSKDINLICDRTHLGENVYSKYRGYNPSYIWKLEEQYSSKNFWNDIHLIFLKDSNIDNVLNRDDGESISTDVNDKLFELKKFEEALFCSKIKNKITLDISNKSREEILNKILLFLKEEDLETKAELLLNRIIEKFNCHTEYSNENYSEVLHDLIHFSRGY